jgi:hypothetical protein
MKTKNLTPAIIYIDVIKDFVEIVGACIENIEQKSFVRLVCVSQSTGATILMNPDDLSVYFNRTNTVPF